MPIDKILSVFFIILINLTNAQCPPGSINLVPNPGFESVTALPNTSCCTQFLTKVNNWSNSNGTGTPDYFNQLANTLPANSYDLPVNAFGTIAPHSGDVIVGIVLHHTTLAVPNMREYVDVQLTSALVPGETYNISFWATNGVCNGSKAGMSSNNIGLHFSIGALTQTLQTPLGITPTFNDISLFYNTGWQQFTFQHSPSLADDHITIGNFYNDANTINTIIDIATTQFSYLYLDDFCISLASSFSTSSNDTICINDSVQIWSNGVGPFSWVDTSNYSAILGVTDSIYVSPTSTTTYGVYNSTDTSYVTVVVLPADTIGFTYTFPDPCDSSIVQFTATSTGLIDSVEWWMGFPGGFGTDTVNTVNFPGTNTYNINLWVYGACGWTDTTISFLQPSTPPAVNYVLNNYNINYCDGDIPANLSVTDISGTSSGGVVNWYSDPTLTTNIGTGTSIVPSATLGIYNYYAVETYACGGRLIDSVTVSIINCVTCPNNLVPNPGFETYSTCPPSGINAALPLATPWSNPPLNTLTATTDFMHSCSGGGITPAPSSGSGAIQITVYNDYCEYREYAQAPLNQTLVQGKCYQASMHVYFNRPISTYGIDSIGMHFSSGAVVAGDAGVCDPNNNPGVLSPGRGLITATPQVVNDASVDLLGNTWQLVTGTFIANGGEDYITVGNFTPDVNLSPTHFGPWPMGVGRSAIYWIDDICLYEIPSDTFDLNIIDTTSCSAVTLMGPVDFNQYFWYDVTNTLISNTQILNVTTQGTTIYTLYSVDTTLCPIAYYRDSITITINNLPNAGTNNNLSFCSNDPSSDLFAQLGGAPDIGGVWAPVMNSGSGVFDPTIDPSGTYTYSVTNSCGTASADVVVAINSNPNPGSNGSVSFCSNDPSSDLFAQLGGTPDLGGVWDPVMNSSIGIFDPTIDPSGTYTYTVSGTLPCTDSSTEIIVTILPLSDATIISDSVFCELDSPLDLQAQSLGGTWTGTGITNSSNGTFDPGTATVGVHAITYEIAGMCGATDTIGIEVNENPVISYSSIDDSCYLQSGAIDLNITGGTTPYDYFWSNSFITEDLSGLDSGSFSVLVTDFMGCTQSKTIVISEVSLNCGGNIWLPNIFSPNNDGLNDELFVRGAESTTAFLFMIYDRWGEKVFESTDPNQGWDGTYNGRTLNNAVFAYLVSVTFIDGNDASISGTITLVK